MQDTIPSVARGLQVLKLLSSPMTLEEVIRHTRIPKTTVLRILNTLRKDGFITRNETTRTYLSTIEFVVRDSSCADEFERILDGVLARLASETGNTSEWYLPTQSGHVLARRYLPPHTQVYARTWLGYVKEWTGQLDAVTCAARAGWEMYPKPNEELWEYGPNCKQVTLDHSSASEKLRKAAERGYAIDEFVDELGIRRTACLVSVPGEMPVGVLALAQCDVPGLSGQLDRNLSMLLREAGPLRAEAYVRLRKFS